MDGFSLVTAMAITGLLSFMISGFLFALSRSQRAQGPSPSYILLAVSYGLNGLRIVSQLLAMSSASFPHPVADIFYIGFISTFWLGVESYARPVGQRRLLAAIPSALVVWAVFARATGLPFPWVVIPQHFVGTLIFGLSGYYLWSLHRDRANAGHLLLAAMMWIQAASTASYPFTRTTWYAPYGFSLFSLLSTAIGMGFIISALRDEQLKLLEEIESRKLAEESRTRSLAFVEAIMKNSPTGIVVFEGDTGNCVLANQAIADMVGGSIDAMLKYNTREITSWQESGLDKVVEATLVDGTTRHCEVTFRSTFGKSVLGEYFVSRFDVEGNPYLLLIASDISERKSLEAQLLQSQKMEAIGQLAGGVAHDFNNILQVILGYTGLIKMKADQGFEAEYGDALEHVVNSAEKAAQLTNGLLAFSRKQVIDLRDNDLNAIVCRVEKFLVRIIGEDIRFRATLDRGKLPVKVDSGQVEQVLINLATNARDAMPKGGVLDVETGVECIDVSFEQMHGYGKAGFYAVITVSDSGTGMDEATRSRIFEPFFTTKEVGKGTGLGMSMVYGIVKQHNGFINVYSELGHGTTFKIYFPVVEPEARVQLSRPTTAVAPGGRETILLAEDDGSVRELMVAVLEKFGYRVIQAVDGQQAIEMFAVNREHIGLVLMDMIMPRKSGSEAYEEISRLQPDVKVLYSSGYTSDFIQKRGLSEDGIDLIMKPVKPMELLRRVRQALDS